MSLENTVEKNLPVVQGPESKWQKMWRVAKEFDRGVDNGAGVIFGMTLWNVTAGLSFLCSKEARNYNIQTTEESASSAEKLGAKIGKRIGLYSGTIFGSVLMYAFFPYSLGVLAVTNTAGYFYYQRKIQERQQKQLQLPEK